MKKKILAFTLAMLMLVSCGCASVPAVEDEEDAYIAGIDDTADLVNLASSKSKEVRVSPSDKAAVRGGDYANKTWGDIESSGSLEIKKGASNKPNDTRETFLEFDLTEIAKFNFETVYLIPSWTRTNQHEHTVSIYRVEPDSWDGKKVTYNTKPALGELICELKVDNATKADLTSAVKKAIADGKTKLSICIVGTNQYQGNSDKLDPNVLLVASAGGTLSNYVYELVENEDKNQEIWDYCQQIVNEWYERYQLLLKQGTNDAELIVSDADEFSKTVYSTKSGGSNSNISRANPTRTYDALDDLGKYTDYDTEYEFDVYGGWMNPAMRQEATGFFYTKEINGRWWFIDPLGYPCYMRTLSGPSINYLSSAGQKAAALEKYGTAEKWEIATVRWLKDDLYFNADRKLTSVELPTVTEMSSILMADGYGKASGTRVASDGGSAKFANGIMNVLDPGFVDYCDKRASELYTDLGFDPNDPWVTGYTTDNETTMDNLQLMNYLKADCTQAKYYYSYAAAWTWLIKMTGKNNPSLNDVTDDLTELFRGFVYDRYFKVVDEAMDKYYPNHLNLGCRFLTQAKDCTWVLRFASFHIDVITINWYHQWIPDANDLYEMCKAVDMPMMVTEFYTKAAENDGSFDDPRKPLANSSTGAMGWLVRTQQDRGDFYQNFTLRLLECKNMVGWQWHQYLDNDDSSSTGDKSNNDVNKGIVNNWHEPYEELCDAMAEINKNVYRLALHFDAKYAAKNAK